MNNRGKLFILCFFIMVSFTNFEKQDVLLDSVASAYVILHRDNEDETIEE